MEVVGDEYDLRIWKLSGLVSAYTLAVAVNLGLFVAAAVSSISALFIPWIIINFVAILGFFSLFLGIIIVHLAYKKSNHEGDHDLVFVNDLESKPGGGFGIWTALLPLGKWQHRKMHACVADS